MRGRLLDLVLLAGGEGREEVLGIHVVSREKRGKFEALSQRKDKAISQVRYKQHRSKLIKASGSSCRLSVIPSFDSFACVVVSCVGLICTFD